jgi:hypothetical protein
MLSNLSVNASLARKSSNTGESDDFSSTPIVPVLPVQVPPIFSSHWSQMTAIDLLRYVGIRHVVYRIAGYLQAERPMPLFKNERITEEAVRDELHCAPGTGPVP